MSAPFKVGQDRSIDPLTAQYFCVGCPFKQIVSSQRNPSSNGDTNPTEWSNVFAEQAPAMKVGYRCTSPNFNTKTTLLQDTSTIGFGYCPFFKQRWELHDGNPEVS
jgi:hypothetical protein